MPVAVLFLLLGTLAAEITLFGVWIAAPIGAGLLGCSALSLAIVGRSRRRQARAAAAGDPAPVTVRTLPVAPAPRGATAVPARRSAA